MAIERRGSPNMVISVDGAFDNEAAAHLKALVLELDAGASVTVDFRAVRLFHDCAIEALAEALARHPTARLVGLSEHHYRLLRYFRSDTTSASPA